MSKETKKPSNPPAFPCDFQHTGYSMQNGMTLRDYFANSAMQSIIINVNNNAKDGTTSAIYADAGLIAKESYEIADAMLKQRENE